MLTLKSERIFSLGNFLDITNTYLTSFIIVSFLIISIYFFKQKMTTTPGYFQIFIEVIFEKLYHYWINISGYKNLLLFSFCLTMFIYILFANWFGILPFINAIYINHEGEKINLLRSVYSDLNMTLALSLISVLVINILGIVKLGKIFLKRFIGFVGILELIGEFSKILSFAFRLFGNVFAGKVLLIIISSLAPLLAPLPFLGLEIFVGFIQAFIFFTLTTIFLKVALTDDH